MEMGLYKQADYFELLSSFATKNTLHMCYASLFMFVLKPSTEKNCSMKTIKQVRNHKKITSSIV